MREKFIQWFQINFPGTPLTGPTEAGEFSTWSAGYVAGMDNALQILNRTHRGEPQILNGRESTTCD